MATLILSFSPNVKPKKNGKEKLHLFPIFLFIKYQDLFFIFDSHFIERTINKNKSDNHEYDSQA